MDDVIPQEEGKVYVQALTPLMNKEVVLPPAANVGETVTTEEGINAGNGKHEVENGKHEVEKANSDTVKLYFNTSNSFMFTRNGDSIGLTMLPTKEAHEVYFERMFKMPPNHEFYCPSCHTSIDKVLFCTTRPTVVPTVTVPSVAVPPVTVPSVAVPPVTVPPVTWPPVTVPPVTLPPVTVPPVTLPPVTVPPVTLPPVTVPPEAPVDGVRCSTCFSLLIQKGKEFITGLVSRGPEVPGVPVPEPGLGEHSIDVTDESTTRPLLITPTTGSGKGWEVLKSIVYGGLAELLASLSVVTSAAGADAATLSIFALGIANLIGGLTVLTHNIRDLKASKPRVEGSETDAEEDKYYELLGRRENYYLHAFFAVLSFLIFGLVPPVVYGFSFRESDDKDLKLAAVAGASLICITLLAIAKAQIKTNTFMTFFTTVTLYVGSGAFASLLTYVAGAETKKLVEQLGWFQPKSNLGLSLPHVSVENYGWGSY